MKTHTADERISARKRLPKPVSDFLLSTAITEVYMGILNKHQLNLRQIGTLSEVVNVTLEGLEPQSGLEANLHEAMPELPNATMRELMLDINDRIFKEATRRLKENVTEPDTWDTATFGPKPTEEELHKEAVRRNQEEKNDDDPELIAKDEAELEKTIEAQEVDSELALRTIEKDNERIEREGIDLVKQMSELAKGDLDKLTPEELAVKYPRGGVAKQAGPEMKQPIRPREETPVLSEQAPAFIKRTSVVEEKLGASVVQKPTETVVGLSVPEKNTVPPAPPSTPAPTQGPKKSDPYREIVD